MVDLEAMFARSARMIAEVASGPRPIATGMGQWFDYCEEVAPEQGLLWKRLRELDFEKDARGLSKWIERLFNNETPPDSINGLWFGLYNPILDDDEPTCQMYVGGAAGFDPGSDSNDCVCQLTWSPEERYPESPILTDLYRSLQGMTENDVIFLGEAFLCHGYLALIVSNWCHGPMRTILLGNAAIRAVVMGHDSGDFYRMAVLRAGSAA